MVRGQLALVVAVVTTVAALFAPGTAAALDGYYNCVLKPAGQWCDGRANGTYDGVHSWDSSEAWYPGVWDNTVTACERLYKPSNGTTLGSSCAANYVFHNYISVTCVCYEAHAMQVSGGAHSINGHAVAN
jgi:hypothetical protein